MIALYGVAAATVALAAVAPLLERWGRARLRRDARALAAAAGQVVSELRASR